MRSWLKFSSFACIAALGTFIIGCGGEEEGTIGSLDQAAKMVCGTAKTVNLVGDDGTVVGQVSVKNDQNKVYVTYTTKDAWKILNIKFHVAEKLNNIPKFGNGQFNRFAFDHIHWYPKMVTTITQDIKLKKNWKVGDTLYVAAFARVVKVTNGQIATQGSWGNDGSFTYMVNECYLDVSLPPGAVTMVPTVSTKDSPWTLTLSKVPDGYDVWDGAWKGWCVEKTVYMTPNVTYTAKLVSSQDTANLPDRAKNVNWQLVNYLLNHKKAGATYSDIQNAIWYLLGYITYPTDPDAQAMILDAQTNGKTFRPTYGDDIAVIFLSNVGVQLVFLEVAP